MERVGVLVAMLAAVILVGAAACSDSIHNPSEGPAPILETSAEAGEDLVDRIAYVSPLGDLFTVGPDGNNQIQLTGGRQVGQGPEDAAQAQSLRLDEYYAWPTWSADGTKIAASRVSVRENRAEITLQVMDAQSGNSHTVYKNQQAGLIADGAPHYIYWAPTGGNLSFLASTPDGLSLLVWDGTPGRAPDVVERGAPLYYHWSPDASAMARHVGAELTYSRPAAGGAPQQVAGASGGFRAPAISPDGRDLAYAVDTPEGSGLFITPIDDLSQSRKVMDIGILAAFSWSPDGTRLAVGDQQNPRSPILDRLVLTPADGGPSTTLSTEGVLAFFWSPSGENIAWIEVNASNQEMEWVVSPGAGTDAKRLFSFQPSSQMFILFSFFDQYAYSHSPWSPDGKSLVMAGQKGEVARRSNGLTPTGDRIYVLDIEGDPTPRDLGPGVLAVWSWN